MPKVKDRKGLDSWKYEKDLKIHQQQAILEIPSHPFLGITIYKEFQRHRPWHWLSCFANVKKLRSCIHLVPNWFPRTRQQPERYCNWWGCYYSTNLVMYPVPVVTHQRDISMSTYRSSLDTLRVMVLTFCVTWKHLESKRMVVQCPKCGGNQSRPLHFGMMIWFLDKPQLIRNWSGIWRSLDCKAI